MNLGPAKYDSIDLAFIDLIDYVLSGSETSPRGAKTVEREFVSFTLTNPRLRIVSLLKRKFYLPLALAECVWNLEQRKDAGYLAQFTSAWEISADCQGNINDSCYGKKIFDGGVNSQWNSCVKLLRADKLSRRAVLSFYGGANTSHLNSKDVSCTSSMQFLIRENKLNTIVNMRSNDLYIGFPYDVFLFTVLSELMANELGVELGEYTHSANSMHIYEENYEEAKGIKYSDRLNLEERVILSNSPQQLAYNMRNEIHAECFEGSSYRILSLFEDEKSFGNKLNWRRSMLAW